MPHTQRSYKNILQLIADILSFQNSIEDLKLKMCSNTIDWDSFVTIASDHLVLTTCYCRLSQKGLLIFLPKDLENYLEKLTAINRNRNHSLINQVHHIATIFNNNNINYTLLKGTALLIGGYFKNLGERMVGDIDILVEEQHIQKAYDLLINDQFKGAKETLRAKYFEDKHLPRLTSSRFIGAVEVHRKVLTKSYKCRLETKDILQLKTRIESTSIPCENHLLEHSILNFQLNDSGYFYNAMSLRSLYDSIIIIKTIKTFDTDFFELPYAKSYTSIGALFFNDFSTLASNTLYSKLFIRRVNKPLLRKSTNFILKKIMVVKLLSIRLILFIKNTNYRKDVLKDYKRIILLLKS